MARKKYDAVVDAVHYKPDGQVAWVRAYERRGPTFSDHVLIERETLIERLRSGQKFVVGQRVPYLASTFKFSEPVPVVQLIEEDILVTGDVEADQDQLDGVPVI
jgi:hypothetical protein